MNIMAHFVRGCIGLSTLEATLLFFLFSNGMLLMYIGLSEAKE